MAGNAWQWSSGNSSFAAPSQQQSQAAISFQPTEPVYPNERLRSFRDAYNEQSPSCRFQTFFYNRVDPQNIAKYGKPQNVSEKLWNTAVQNNPDPSILVPTLAVGFGDLHKRIIQQHKAAEQMRTALEMLASTFQNLEGNHIAGNIAEINTIKREHAFLQNKALRVMNKMEMIRSREMSFMSSEAEYKRDLESLQRKLQKPKQFLIKARNTSLTMMPNNGRTLIPMASSVSMDPNTASNIYLLLDSHRLSLAYSMQLLRTDELDMDAVIAHELQLQQSLPAAPASSSAYTTSHLWQVKV